MKKRCNGKLIIVKCQAMKRPNNIGDSQADQRRTTSRANTSNGKQSLQVYQVVIECARTKQTDGTDASHEKRTPTDAI